MQCPTSTSAANARESVWDYPVPPRVEPDSRHVVVRFNAEIIAETDRAIRVLERGGAPVLYIPPEDVRIELLESTGEQTWCGHKGDAHYYDVVAGDRTAASAAWCYPEPKPGYEAIQHMIAFYPARVDACTVDGEPAAPQPGGYYGGWVTAEIDGPFKGEPGAPLH